MKVCDVVLWNVMIGVFVEYGCGYEVYDLFFQMQIEGCKLDVIMFLSILNVCVSVGVLEWVKKIYRYVLDLGFEVDVCVGIVFVYMYLKSGSIDDV